jgi:hypothetical protein
MTTTPGEQPEPAHPDMSAEPWYQPASDTFQAAYDDDGPAILAGLKALEALGGEALVMASSGWIDTMFGAAHPDLMENARAGRALMGFAVIGDDGTISEPTSGTTGVPASVQWAAALVEKRAVRDYAGYMEVFGSPATEAEFGAGLVALAQMCGQAVRLWETGAVAARSGGGQ